MIRVGPAGWSYPDWKGLVYPSPAPRGFDPLADLAARFDMIEINSSFYGPPTEKTATSWVRRVQHRRSFRFTAKLWKRFTHERVTRWTHADVDAVREGFDALAESGRLGAVLMQFPWSFRATDENREWLSDLVRIFGIYPLVVEIRHSSWDEPEFLIDLASQGVGFANIDQPQFHDSLGSTAHVTARVGYIRVHGRNYREWFRANAPPQERYNYLYSADELRPWAARAVQMQHRNPKTDVYVVTNNHTEGKGVVNAIMLQSEMGLQPGPIPPTLLAHYPKELAGARTRSEPPSQGTLF